MKLNVNCSCNSIQWHLDRIQNDQRTLQFLPPVTRCSHFSFHMDHACLWGHTCSPLGIPAHWRNYYTWKYIRRSPQWQWYILHHKKLSFVCFRRSRHAASVSTAGSCCWSRQLVWSWWGFLSEWWTLPSCWRSKDLGRMSHLCLRRFLRSSSYHFLCTEIWNNDEYNSDDKLCKDEVRNYILLF